MGTDVTFGSLFAGVGGFDLGMEAAGWRCGWQVEWDKDCQQVLARHWPDVPRWSDVSTVSGADLPPVDCVTFGSPCQDLSKAGKGAGLAGERSGLFHQAVRIIKEMRDATGDRFPRWAIWENVPGAFTSNKGADFQTVLEEMADIGAYLLEWHILDARWFGVPQRRRRLFVVACFDSGTVGVCPEPLLPVPTRSGWHPPQGAAARETVTGDVAYGVGGYGDDVAGPLGCNAQGGHRGDLDSAGAYVTVPAEPDSTFRMLAFGKYADDDTASALKQRDYKDATDLIVTKVFVKGKRAQSVDDYETWREDETSPTINVFDMGDSRTTVAITQNAAMRVRRLTPLEAERLMGWPDDHTRWRADGKQQSDTARYRQIGNGVASPVAAWIGKHIYQVEAQRE